VKLFKKDQAPSRAEAPAEPVKTVGNHVASVKLHPAVTARVGFEVIPA